MAARTKLPKRPAAMPKRPKVKRPPMQLWDALDVVAVVRRLAAAGMPTRAGVLAALGNGRSAGTSLDTLVREGLVWRPTHGHYLPADMPSPDGEAAPHLAPLPTREDLVAFATAAGRAGVSLDAIAKRFDIEHAAARRLGRDATMRGALVRVGRGTFGSPTLLAAGPTDAPPFPLEAARALGLGEANGELMALGPTDTVRDVLLSAQREPDMLVHLGEVVRWAVARRGFKRAHEVLGMSSDKVAVMLRVPEIRGGLVLKRGRPRATPKPAPTRPLAP